MSLTYDWASRGDEGVQRGRAHPEGEERRALGEVPREQKMLKGHLPREVVVQKSIPTQIRQLVLYIRNSKGYVDRFWGELTSSKRLLKHFV